MKRPVDFRNAPVGRLLARLAIPAFLGIVINQLYGFVDGVFIGRGVGIDALGGVTIVFPLTLLVVAFASLIGEGVASIVALAAGRGEEALAVDTIRTGHGAAFWMSVGLVLASLVSMEGLMRLLGATAAIEPFAESYYRAILWGLPFMGLSLVYFHQLNAQGEIRAAMEAMAVSTLLNAILDYVAIFRLGWGVAGAAYATAFSQMAWYAFMHLHANRNPRILTVAFSVTLRIDRRRLGEIVLLGLSSFVRQIGVAAAMIVINAMASRYGSGVYIAAFGASQRIFKLMIAPIVAIGTAFKPIAGQNYGFRAFGRVKSIVYHGLWSSGVLGFALLSFVLLFRNALGSLFGMGIEEMPVFTRVLILTSCLLPLYGIHHIAVSYFTALGKPKEAIVLNLMKQMVFLVPLLFVLPEFLGVYGLFAAIPAADIMSIGIALFLMKRDLNRLKEEGILQKIEAL